MAASDKANVAFARVRRQITPNHRTLCKTHAENAKVAKITNKKAPQAKQRAGGTPIVLSSSKKEGKTVGSRRGTILFITLFIIL